MKNKHKSMFWKMRCTSSTYAGRFVIELPDDDDPFGAFVMTMTVGGNARQRRRQVREARRAGYIVTRGGVSS